MINNNNKKDKINLFKNKGLNKIIKKINLNKNNKIKLLLIMKRFLFKLRQRKISHL